MQRFGVERRIRDVHARLVRARQELAVLDEQLAVVSDEAEDARLRSLVSETPLAAHEYAEVKRHADAMVRARQSLVATVEDLDPAPGRAAAVGGERPVSAVEEQGRPIRVVIAEDEAIIRLDLKEILVVGRLRGGGGDRTGRPRRRPGGRAPPGSGHLGLKMPGMDGVRAAREITTDHKVAVLVLTAFSQRELIEDARDAGVAAYLVKPFRREELLPAIEDALFKCRQEWAIEREIEELDQPADDDDGRAEDKIETRRLVDEAKGVLMDRHDLSEPDAFAFVQRTAMQTRSRMRDVARRVVSGDLAPAE